MKRAMMKKILVISEEGKLLSKLHGDLSKSGHYQVLSEPHGEEAYKRIKQEQPDMMIVDLETPNLVQSWLAINLAADESIQRIPAVMMSEILDKEEREIVSDMTGFPVLPKDTGVSCLQRCMV